MTPWTAQAFELAPFTSVYLLEDEWASEIINRTVHGVMHIGWVPDGTGGYRGEMAVLVKRTGGSGTCSEWLERRGSR